MKLEKREITLNEYDSLQDAYYMQKTVLQEYLNELDKTNTKQLRNEWIRLITENIEDAYFLLDLMNGSAIENQKN